MAGIDANALAEIKARIDLADLISEYGVDLRRAGSSVKACCPFHKEKTPSFIINVDRGFYKCFGCGESGDAITFVQKMEGITFVEAVRKLAERAGVKIEERFDPQAKARARLYQINQELAAFYRRCLEQTAEAQEARDYLKGRDLWGEPAERFGIGYAPNIRGALLEWAKRHDFTPDELVAAGVLAAPRTPGDSYYDRFHGRLTFPICDPQGRVIAFSCRLLRESKHTGKYVNSPETEIFKKADTLYAFHLARPNIAKAVPRRAIVCEGQIDVIRCHVCGFPTAVASQGTAFTAEHVALLRRCADSADLVFDGDKAGVKAAIRTMGLFLAAGMPVRIVSLPPEDDPDSLLRKQGAEAFRACLDSAEDPAPFLVRRLRQQETAPDAMDAVMRIAKAAVATVLDCPEPVLTARFLQDAANALHLPVETLTQDLESLRADAAEAERRREAFRARQEAQPTVAIEQPPPFDDGWDDADEAPLDVYPEDSAEPEPAPALADLEASRNLAGALCELLAHHFHEPDVMGCLIRHLPPAFVHNPFASKVYDLAVAASLNGARTLSPPDDDPAFKDYLARIFAAPDRIVAAGEDITPLTYAQDLVRAYWLREYERRAKMLDPDSIEAFTLTQSRKRLQSLSWQAAEPYLDALNPVLAAPKPESPPPSKPSTIGEGALQEDQPVPASNTVDYEATPPPPIPDPNLPPAWDPPDEEEDIYDTL